MLRATRALIRKKSYPSYAKVCRNAYVEFPVIYSYHVEFEVTVSSYNSYFFKQRMSP